MITNVQELDFNLLSKVTKKKQQKPKVLEEVTIAKDHENTELVRVCEEYWTNLQDFRDRTNKNLLYYRGDQWHELMEDPDDDDTVKTEENYIKDHGKIPFKFNYIRQLVRNVIGIYRNLKTESVAIARARVNASVTDMVSSTIEYVNDVNDGTELDVAQLEIFLNSGFAMYKMGYNYMDHMDIMEVQYAPVDYDRVFFNSDVKNRRWDGLHTVGEIIDAPLDQIINAFARTKSDEDKIREVYKWTDTEGGEQYYETFSKDNVDNIDFYVPINSRLCRVYEVWQQRSQWTVWAHDYADGSFSPTEYTKQDIAAFNAERIAIGTAMGKKAEEIPLIDPVIRRENFWHVKYLTPDGYCLMEMRTPYEHQRHPYVLLGHPFVKGMIWGLVEDTIDPQRILNRLFSLWDFILGAGAKGVLMVPEDMIPTGMSPEKFAKEWTSFNGMIVYKPSKTHNQMPKQITASSTNVGIQDMISFVLKMFQETSGTNDAMQGRTAKSGTPASLYAQEAQNAMNNIKDYLDSFNWFKEKRDTMIIKLIKQFYTEPRYIAVAGKAFSREAVEFRPEKVSGIDMFAKITQATDTPTYRAMIEDSLLMLLDRQIIDGDIYLENSSLPMSDKILDSIRQRREQIQQGQVPQGSAIPPEMLNQAANAGNPKAQEMLSQYMS